MINHRKALALALGLLGLGCGDIAEPWELGDDGLTVDELEDASVAGVDQAITDSVDVPAHEEKRMVKIEGGGSSCSASFLRPGLIITADHCPSGSDLVVRTGVTGFDPARTPRRLDARSIGGGVDLKLIKVSTDYNPSVNIDLASDCDLQGKVITVYGRKKDASFLEDDGFRKRDMTVRSIDDFSVGEEGVGTWTFTGLETDRVTVPGDSGGPSYFDGQLVGVNSGGGLFGAVMASTCHYRSEIIASAAELGFDLTKPFSTSTFDYQVTAKCADSVAGLRLSDFKNCIANNGVGYVKDHPAWKINVVIHCDRAVIGGGTQSHNEYWRCLADRDVSFDNNAAWQSEVRRYCLNAQVGGGYRNYNGYKQCLSERRVSFVVDADWTRGVKDHCLKSQVGGGYKNYNGYKQCLSERSVGFVADSGWCSGVHNYCKAQWYPFGGKDQCYRERSCSPR